MFLAQCIHYSLPLHVLGFSSVLMPRMLRADSPTFWKLYMGSRYVVYARTGDSERVLDIKERLLARSTSISIGMSFLFR